MHNSSRVVSSQVSRAGTLRFFPLSLLVCSATVAGSTCCTLGRTHTVLQCPRFPAAFALFHQRNEK